MIFYRINPYGPIDVLPFQLLFQHLLHLIQRYLHMISIFQERSHLLISQKYQFIIRHLFISADVRITRYGIVRKRQVIHLVIHRFYKSLPETFVQCTLRLIFIAVISIYHASQLYHHNEKQSYDREDIE